MSHSLPFARLVLRRCSLVLACLAAGASWAAGGGVEEIETPAAANSQQHRLGHTADGRLILSWVEVAEGRSSSRFSVRDGDRWTAPATVASVPGKLAAPPVVMGLADGALAAAWMSYVPGSTDRTSAEIRLARSADGGRTWSEPARPYGDDARVYDAQMSLAALPAGRLALVWTDKRHVQAEGAGHAEHSEHAAHAQRYQLIATVMDAALRPGEEITLDSDVCSCCRSDTAAQGGELVTVYRDHAGSEVRDIAAARWNPAGEVRSGPVHVDGWVLNGCPSNGPAVDMRGAQAVVAWFTAADGAGRVRLAFSSDAGASFGDPIEVDSEAVGYADTVLLEDGSAMVSWRGRNGPQEELRAARVAPNGAVLGRVTIYQGGFPNWPSKYPELERAGGKAYVAWTDPLLKRVRLVAVSMGD
ncbi:sialidase family protein [Methylogaea oryzae]|uniref:sialidase family protein n=2 Tax=Methylogaea oryzae TaxID=1295382 RepID=UPI001C8197C9|nr:sialidase family protein [Methylogaea oryzae]